MFNLFVLLLFAVLCGGLVVAVPALMLIHRRLDALEAWIAFRLPLATTPRRWEPDDADEDEDVGEWDAIDTAPPAGLCPAPPIDATAADAAKELR